VGEPAGLRRLEPDGLGDHLDRLYRAARALCGSPHEAEDLVQDTYARVLARPRWLRAEDDLGYLLRALRNTHASRARAAARRPRTTLLPDDVPAREPVEVMALFGAIADLDAPFRDALVAVDLVGLSYREAARSLRVREGTITTRVHRARRKVAAALGEGTR
jgi:RNA polymerase sigma-70 factor (ECF subfamily)